MYFESALVPECVNDKFSKPFKSYLDKDAVYNFISTMIEETKYCRLKKTMKVLRTQLNVGYVIMIILILILK